MGTRQIIISLLGIGILAAAIFVNKKISVREDKEAPKQEIKIPSVFVETVKNTNTAINVTASGNLAARDRIELFSEVQGIFEYSSNSFKPGVYYKEGQTLLRVNSDEHRANLRAQKSSLLNQIVTLLPDLRFDFPEAFPKWETYVTNFDMEKTLQALPSFDTNKEKLFVSGKNITTLWYNVKNLEERLSKYSLYAPYGGVLTETLVDKGALIRAGQKLGVFINPNIYELEVAVNSEYADVLKVGNTVTLNNVERTQSWKGTVSRINSLIDPGTQTLQVFIRVNGKNLREGMYLEADLAGKQEANTYEISRKLLVDNDKIFVLRDSIIKLVTINPVYFKDKTVVLRGLEDGTQILSRSVPGAYSGMKVQVLSKDVSK